MVTPDAFFWQLGATPLLMIMAGKRNIQFGIREIVLLTGMIALSHEIYGVIGLGLRAAGILLGATTFVGILSVVSYLVLGFIVNGSAGAEEGDVESQVLKLLLLGIVSVAAFFGAYTGISIDELFAVLARVEWMTSQGWSYWVMAANITVAMTILWAILLIEGVIIYLVVKKAEDTMAMDWLEKHEGWVMFFVFSFLAYFTTRGWYQNYYGYNPVEWHIMGHNTGFAYYVYIVGGFLPMIILRLLLLVKPVRILLLWLCKPQQKMLDWLEELSQRRAERKMAAMS